MAGVDESGFGLPGEAQEHVRVRSGVKAVPQIKAKPKGLERLASFRDGLMVIGIACIVGGTAMVSVAASLIVGGLLLIGLSLVMAEK
jgi:hypothetical protein